jgi:integrase
MASSIDPMKYEWRMRSDGRRYKHPLPGTTWRARFRDPNGRSRSQNFSRKVDAERFLERNGADIQRGDWVDPAFRRARFDDWACEWWATTIKLRPSTRRGYWLLLNNHVLPCFGGRLMATIDYMDVERFIADKLSAGNGAKHVREMVSVVSLIMTCAVKAKARRDNPAAGHKLRVPRKRSRRTDMLTMEQAIRLVDKVADRYKLAIWMLLFTGMRPAELCGVKVRDLDPLRGAVRITESRAPVAGFDGGSRQHIEGPVKTDSIDRNIPIPRWLCEGLARLLADRAEQRGSPIDPEEHLFLNKDARPVNRDTFRAKTVRPALKAAGLPDAFRTYDFRHSHASMLIDDGANPVAVAERMGHSDPSITLRVYGHLFEGVQQQLTDRLETRREAAVKTPGPAELGNLGKRRRGRYSAPPMTHPDTR